MTLPRFGGHRTKGDKFLGARSAFRRGSRAEVAALLSDLATHGRVSASTQNQALAAILFLYGAVFERELPWLDDIVRARRPHRVPVALTPAGVRALLRTMEGRPRLGATLLYGAGLRLLEARQLRIKDVDWMRAC